MTAATTPLRMVALLPSRMSFALPLAPSPPARHPRRRPGVDLAHHLPGPVELEELLRPRAGDDRVAVAQPRRAVGVVEPPRLPDLLAVGVVLHHPVALDRQ